MNSSRSKRIVALFITGGVILSACAPSGSTSAVSPQASAQTGGTITARLPGDFDTLDPHKTRNTNGYQLAFALYDRLVARDEKGTVVPYLASSWDVTATSFTGKLRGDATCSDGSKVTATVVADSFKRLGNPDTNAPYSYRTLGRAGFTAIGDDAAQTIKITLNAPNSDLLLGLTMPWASVVCGAGLKDPSTLDMKPSGSGPFALEAAKRGDSYTLKARPDFKWGQQGLTTASPGFPDKLVFRVLDNVTTAANLLLNKELDIAQVVGQDLARVAADKDLTRQDVLGFGSDGLQFMEKAGHPTADPIVRKALAMAVDNAAWTKAAYFDSGQPMTTFYTPGMSCYDANNGAGGVKYDPQGAKQLLLQNGWTAGADGKLVKGGQPLAIRIISSTRFNAGGEYLLNAFQAVGVSATLTNTDFNTWLDAAFKGDNWDVTVQPYGGIMPSGSLFMLQVGGPPPPAGGNNAYVTNDTYDKTAAAAFAAGPDKACALWLEAERALISAVDAKPLSVSKGSIFSRGVRVVLFTDRVFAPIFLSRTR